MQFLVGELSETIAAALVLTTLLAFSGAFFGAILRFPGFAAARGIERIGLSLLCALACLPVLLDLAGRAGIWSMTAAALVFAGLGAPDAIRAVSEARGARARAAIWLFLWALLVGCLAVDWPTLHGLRHSVLVGDYVKHSTTTWAIAASATPPYNPTAYVAGGHASYYYFFYTLTAVDALLLRPLGVAARHAAFAGAIVMGPALLALAHAIWKRAGTDEAAGAPDDSRPIGLLFALLLATGLDIIPTVALVYLRGDWVLNPEEWDVQVTSWFSSVLWVPHHVAGLSAAFVGLIALTRRAGDADAPLGWRRALLAGLAFASMAGLSVYLAMGGALTAAVWTLVLVARKRWSDALTAVAAGLIALALAAPWLATVVMRAAPGAPRAVAFALRSFPITDAMIDAEPLRIIVRAVMLPIGYGLEFGIFGLGAFMFWRRTGRAGANRDLGLVLVIATAVSFVVGTFMKSTVILNDLGWRVMLFAQMGTLIWTLSAWRGGAFATGEIRRVAFIFIGLSYAAIAYAMVHIRYDPIGLTPPQSNLAEEIAAWRWLDARLPTIAVVQENPVRLRAFDYGMYGRFPEIVSDEHNGYLFGPDRTMVDRRLKEIGPIFTDAALGLGAMRALAAHYDISAVVLSASDPVFAAPDAWPQKVKPDFENAHARVYLLPGAANALSRGAGEG